MAVEIFEKFISGIKILFTSFECAKRISIGGSCKMKGLLSEVFLQNSNSKKLCFPLAVYP